jgi:transposase
MFQHGAGEYVSGIHHVNSLEGVWSQLKRGIIGTHIHALTKHLPKCVREFAFRYNNRKNPGQMFEWVIRNFHPFL